ncbi:probable Synaptobrevin homolog YKT6 [Saccharomycodes ludwigii]|uniref:Synaptobrevin homolog YKT6 n=1 Tax=Saccharomycodes ludwigii TaxID=36035 RepID=A0A376B4I2_9ASCO|nr:hypothetical protein SCDLUD_004310 [Saccharomycodes ludwigii]KAH3899993.1 hypothetical protein SCDLUD_004310 [Saccharomycodes ludwigii]SSD59374.1 probable Synaptobrevin homolog YKT6 [Saccharomycodes ludwigii]
MKIYYIGILKHFENKNNSADSTATEICSSKNLSDFGFFERSSVSQFMSFFSNTVASRTGPNKRQSIQEGDNYVGHVYTRSEGITGVLITDKEYPVRAAYTLLNKILEDFLVIAPNWKTDAPDNANIPPTLQGTLDNYINKYQDPSQADSLLKVQQELDETKIVLHKTIEGVLQRGENLDNLVDKSHDLTASSKMFYKQAKKTNSCCVLM